MSGKQNFVKRFFEYYKPYKGLFVADIVAAFFISMCDLVYPLITRTVINDLVPNRLLRTFFVYAALLVIIYLIKLALNYFVMYYGHILGVRMQGDMRR
ncbi:MAG: ABC transporter ATP-binding protein, partial [Oscillospiraceae bacterium]